MIVESCRIEMIQHRQRELSILTISQEKNIHNHIIQLVEQMLYFHKQLNEAQTPPAKKRIQQQINATDRQINQLVYELYGLTDEEIAIDEGA